MAEVKVTFKIKGIETLERDIRELGKLPQVAVSRSARAGANIALKAARKLAPHDLGYLRKGLTLKAEKTTKKGKKVYEVTFNRNYNSIFQKPYDHGRKKAYYPASQEWGFTVYGHYTPGYRYLRKSIDENKRAIELETLSTFGKEIDKKLGR